jgi:glutathione S-transferase
MRNFEAVVGLIENALSSTAGDYFLEDFSTADVIFTPYIERMNASLFYYKGYALRDPEKRPRISAWFDAMETRETYCGTQSDFHTHCHDLPPQMGGCYEAAAIAAQPGCRARIDSGPWDEGPLRMETSVPCPPTARLEAVARAVKHRENIVKANPADPAVADEALRCALTFLLDPSAPPPTPPAGGDSSLRYIRDRINVPRDMGIHAGQYMRDALERTAAAVGTGQGPPIPVRHRRDQDPRAFL